MKEGFYVVVETFKIKPLFRIEFGPHVETFEIKDYEKAKIKYEKLKENTKSSMKRKKSTIRLV